MRAAPHRPLLALVALALVLVLAGCGGDDEEPAETAAEDTATEQAETDATAGGDQGEPSIDVGAVEYAFEPPNPTLDEDGGVSIDLTNEGAAPHALVIEETEASTATIDPGQSDTLTTQLDSGEYVIYCPVANHRQLGMEGTLTVGGGGGGGGGGGSGSGSNGDSGSDGGSGGSGGAY